MHMPKINLAKNATIYTAALTMQKVISFLYFILVARMIGVENIGKFSFALSFTAIFAMVLDFGLTQVLIRESARDKEKTGRYLANAVALKLIGALFIYAAVVIIINVMGYPAITKQLVYVSGLVMLIDSFSLSFFGVLRGNHNLKYESWGVIINQISVVTAGLVVLWLKLGLVPLMAAYAIGSLFNFLFSTLMLKKTYGIKIRIGLEKSILKELLKFAIPFAIAGIFVRLYSSMDIVLLSKMADDQSVGWYSAAYKIAFALQFVGVASLASVYPAFSYYYQNSKEQLSATFTKVLYYLSILSLPLSIGVIAIADKVIEPIFGVEYMGSVPALQILMLCLPLAFLCFPIGAMLNACDRQNWNTANLGVTAIANIILNLILIPKFGYMGSAYAALLSYVIMLSFGLVIVGKIINYDKKYLAVSILKIVFSCAVMAGVVMYLKQYIHFIPVIIIGVVAYFLALLVVKGISIKEFKELRHSARGNNDEIENVNL